MQVNKCAVYTRVSTDNQAEKEDNSCETQEDKSDYFKLKVFLITLYHH